MELQISLGDFEQIVLLAILRLRENAYGVTIRAEILSCIEKAPNVRPGHSTRRSTGWRTRVSSDHGLATRRHNGVDAPNATSPSPSADELR